jgi:hypothetical protein
MMNNETRARVQAEARTENTNKFENRKKKKRCAALIKTNMTESSGY